MSGDDAAVINVAPYLVASSGTCDVLSWTAHVLNGPLVSLTCAFLDEVRELEQWEK